MGMTEREALISEDLRWRRTGHSNVSSPQPVKPGREIFYDAHPVRPMGLSETPRPATTPAWASSTTPRHDETHVLPIRAQTAQTPSLRAQTMTPLEPGERLGVDAFSEAIVQRDHHEAVYGDDAQWFTSRDPRRPRLKGPDPDGQNPYGSRRPLTR